MIVVAFLFPLAVYCLVLGLINRRRRPLLVPATWDFVGVLFAASGFLVFSVPAMLSGFRERWRMLWAIGQAPVTAEGETAYELWMLVSLGYFVAIVGGAAWVLWRRRSQTAIYNIEADVLEEVFNNVLDEAKVPYLRRGNDYYLAPEGQAHEEPDVRVDVSPALYHATLRWRTNDDPRRFVIESALAGVLATVRTRDNPVAGLLMIAGLGLLFLTLSAFGVVVVYQLFGR